MLGRIAYGWVITPVITALMALLLLFIMQNVFERKVVHLRDYVLSPDVIEMLRNNNIPSWPLEQVRGQHFKGSATFRLALLEHHEWKEKELYTIFHFAEIDTMVIDTNRMAGDADLSEFTDRQTAAVKQIHGTLFIHRWQMDAALDSMSDDWRKKEGAEYRLYNNKISENRNILYRLFRTAQISELH